MAVKVRSNASGVATSCMEPGRGGGPHQSSVGQDQDLDVHTGRPVLTTTIIHGASASSSRGGGCRPARKFRFSGTSSAVSSMFFRVRTIVSVRALTARETVG